MIWIYHRNEVLLCYENLRFSVPKRYTPIAKAVFRPLPLKVEIFPISKCRICFTIYQIPPEQVAEIEEFMRKECKATKLPFYDTEENEGENL